MNLMTIMKTTNFKPHYLAEIFPPMTADEFKGLKTSISQVGQLEPIVIFEDKILDGIHRFRACSELKIEPKFTEYDGENPVSFVLARNFNRRHLNTSQRAMIGAKLSIAAQHGGDKSKVQDCPLTIEEAGALVGAGSRTIKVARKIIKSENENLENLVMENKMSLYEAVNVLNQD